MKNTETHTLDNTNLFSDVTEETGEVIENLIVITGDTISNEVIFETTPLFFEAQNKRFIPNKIKRTLERHGSISGLKRIHPKKDVAIELCLIFVSNLANAYYDDNKNGWKHLHSTLLNKQLGNGEYGIYKKVLDFLSEGTKNGGPIVERSSNYSVKNYSYMYKLGKNYQNKGVTLHEFKTTEARNLLSKNYFAQLDSAIKNPIASNLIEFYKNIELPTEEAIIARGRELAAQGYVTKKGKKLIMQNKRAKEYYGDPSNFSFIEDNLELFKRLTQNGYLIPTISEENAGGRVTDSFNLMPSWIRSMCTVNGEPIEEADYSALHPNIAVKIYNGTTKYITHEAVAEELEMDVKKVKIEHLSFFNHKWENMYASPLFKYYSNSSPVMMENMYADKKIGYTVTTKKMFKLEVDIMTSVIQKLNNMGIYVMYVYDALCTTKENLDIVKKVMNETIIEHGVYTIAK